jgi:ADP-ribose pyrophosphatase
VTGRGSPAGPSQPDVEIRSRRSLLTGFFHIEEVELCHRRLDGAMSAPLTRLNLDRGDGAAVVLHDAQRRVVTLVRQFRYPTWEKGPGWLLELVAGVVETGREPDAVARAEAREEAGYEVSELECLGTFYLTPGGSAERIFLYYAPVSLDMRRHDGGGVEHEGEDIEVVEMPEDEVWRALDAGSIADAKTLIGLWQLRHRLRS